MFMLYTISTGDSNHCSGKFTVFTIFIGKLRCVKRNTNLVILFSVVTPIELRMFSFDFQTEVDRNIFNTDTCIDKFCLFSVF